MIRSRRISKAAAPLLASVLALTCASAHALDPTTITPSFGLTADQQLLDAALVSQTKHCQNTLDPCGLSTVHGNALTKGAVAAGPVVTSSIDTSDWNYTTPGYTGQGLVGDASGTLNYFFLVQGPSAVRVPLIVTGSIYMDFTNDTGSFVGYGSAAAYGFIRAISTNGSLFHPTSGEQYSAHCDPSNQATCNTSFTLHLSVDTSSEVGYIEMTAQANFSGSYYNRLRAYATVDPLVQIDPVFLATNPGYSLVFPDGLANQAAAVPEPTAGAMLAAGLLGLLGLSHQRRRRRPHD